MTNVLRTLLLTLTNMSSRAVAISFLLVVAAFLSNWGWDASQASLPYFARFGVLHVAIVALLSLGVIASSAVLRKLRNGKHPFGPKTMIIVVAIGALIGAVVAPIVWAIVPTDSEEKGTAAESVDDEIKKDDGTALLIRKGSVNQTVAMSPLIPDPDLKPASPNDLEFYFFALVSSATPEHIQYANVTVTNRSPRKMHLELWAQVDFWSDNGEPQRHGWKAEWNPDGFKERTGDTFIDLDAWETKKGRLMIFLDKPPKDKIREWFLDSTTNVYVEIFDSVSGKRIAFDPAEGYPAGQMPAPLPSHKQLLAIEFPNLGLEGASLPSLGLVARTRDKGRDKANMSVSALLTNTSTDVMQIASRLLIRSAEDVKIWAAVPGVFKEKGQSPSNHLAIGAGETLERRLSFDFSILGVSADEAWDVSGSPKDTLLEITDLKSGQTVWCDFETGYPPGGDIRAATIVEAPSPNPANPPRDGTKDPR